MALPRFYDPALPAELAVEQRIEISGDEAHHASRVLRLQPEDQVIVFNGQGGEVLCRVGLVQKKALELTVVERLNRDREIVRGLHLISALPKGDRQKVLVDGLVQSGVRKLSPLECERAVVVPKSSVLDKLSRNVIEFSKQCGRNVLMQIGSSTTIGECAQSTGADGVGFLFAHPYGKPAPLAEIDTSKYAEMHILVGPEGGLSDAEVNGLLSTGWQQVSLGSRILRVEMAAISAAAW